MKKTKENCSLTFEELFYLYHDVLSIKEAVENYSSQVKKIRVLAKNHGYFNSVLSEKYALGDWFDLKAGKTIRIKKGEYVNIPLDVAMKLPKKCMKRTYYQGHQLS